jgi:putative FmdB family regulatory protein
MPLYEFRCKTCDATFEERRSMSAANEPATCPAGHDGAVRLLSVFASVGASAGSSPAPCTRGARWWLWQWLRLRTLTVVREAWFAASE